MATGNPSHQWHDITSRLSASFDKVNKQLLEDEQFIAFADTGALEQPLTFGWKSSGSEDAMLCTITRSSAKVFKGNSSEAKFMLCANPDQWESFYQQMPKPPYQSFWGMYGQNIHQAGVKVDGDHLLFLNYAPIWRRVLDLSRLVICGSTPEDNHDQSAHDEITGRYVWADLEGWGKTKLYYEQSGDPSKVPILFLHTAGSDGRQYHGVMNHPDMLKLYHMTVLDMPGHGRSFPGEHQIPGRHTNSEDAYIGIIRDFIKVAKLDRPVLCGASMAGHISIAAALRSDEAGVRGVVPCQGCEFTDMERHFWDRSPFINQSIFCPEYTYGMMAPTSPLRNRNLVWHIYSSQAYSMYHGDLDFYFGGWDGRGRIENIDTKKCPVYMMTGDYDWSTTPAMSESTARKIKGAKFVTMKGLGHFPATENPERFVPYLLDAADFIVKATSSSS